jgi:chemotaxis protein CheY-P-specific phosphatase CheC
MTGLLLAAHESAERMSTRMIENVGGGGFGADTVKVVAAEWANLMITGVLNAFSDILREGIMCTPPEILEETAPAALILALNQGGPPADAIVCEIGFACPSLSVECELWFVVRAELARRLVAAAVQPV